MFWAEIWKISEYLSENCQFSVVKFSKYLNRRVFVISVFGYIRIVKTLIRMRGCAVWSGPSLSPYILIALCEMYQRSAKARMGPRMRMTILHRLEDTSVSCMTPSIRAAAKTITKTRLYNLDPLKPHFYIVKLGFTGVYIIFLISAQNIDCGYSFESPRRSGSNEYPQSIFWAEIRKISEVFIWKFSFFWW